jgi:adenylylsulfate kinase
MRLPRKVRRCAAAAAKGLVGAENEAMDLLLITGSMGAGKSTTMAEASDLLTQADIPHAAIDYHALGLAHVRDVAHRDLSTRNLAAVAEIYSQAGIGLLMVAGAVESPQERDAIVRATKARRVTMCRLRAALSLMEERVAARERGIFSDRYVARVRLLDELLDRAHIEDFDIDTASVGVTEVARELLRPAGVIKGETTAT